MKGKGRGDVPEALGMVAVIIGGVMCGLSLLLMIFKLISGGKAGGKDFIEPSNYHKIQFIICWLVALADYLNSTDDYDSSITYIVVVLQMLFIFGFCCIWCLYPGKKNVCMEMLITFLSFRATANLPHSGWFYVWGRMFASAATMLQILSFITLLVNSDEAMSDKNGSATVACYIAMLYGTEKNTGSGYSHAVYVASSLLLLCLFHWQSKLDFSIKYDWLVFFAPFGICAPVFGQYGATGNSDTHKGIAICEFVVAAICGVIQIVMWFIIVIKAPAPSSKVGAAN